MVMQTVIETPTFIRRSEKLFTVEERSALIEAIAFSPEAGDEIPGTGGVRKLRFGAKGKGKRGGARVIYFFHDEENPIYLLTCYAKNVADDISAAEKRALAAFTAAIKSAARKRRTI
jgi:hypothetical protein